jgi:hypothetical protein
MGRGLDEQFMCHAKKPNKALEPTTMAVTCSEQHGSRQPRSWLILNVGPKKMWPFRRAKRYDSLSLFRAWCKEAFRFLTQHHGFALLRESQQYNAYYVLFGRDDLKIAIKGEGYGNIGSVFYVTSTGLEVPYQCLAPDWEPFFGKSGKRRRKALKKQPERSQEEQIFDAAKTISERDRDILAGDYARLDAVAKKVQAIQDSFKAH